MAMYDNDSIVELIRGVLADARQLIRDELDLMRAEVREEILSARAAGLAFGGAAVAAVLGVTLFCVALAGAIAYLLGWPAWTGYAIVSLLLLGSATYLVIYGRKRLSSVQALPKTRAALKEDFTWIHSKAAPK